LKLIKLFSLIFTISTVAASEPLSESISLRVKVVGKILEEKPKLIPPAKLKQKEDKRYLNLSKHLLVPPKYIESLSPVPPSKGKACGEPKDKAYYRAAVLSYLKGNLKKAETRLLDILAMQNSAFIPQSEYILGLVYVQKGKEEKAIEFFKSSCLAQHPYKQAACEAYYALKFKKERKPVRTENPSLWRVVYEIKNGILSSPSCDKTVFKSYCAYVKDFVEGNINPAYRESTEVRRAIVLVGNGNLSKAKEILKRHSRPLSKYRDIALYYLGVIAYLEGNKEKVYKIASLLEISKPDYSENLLLLISQKDIIFSKIAYKLTGDLKALKYAGIIAYNRKKYDLAYANFEKAGEFILAAWAAIRKGDYLNAYKSLKKVTRKDRDYYLWILETLYWLGKDPIMEETLRKIKTEFPALYGEYKGWLLFRRGKWLKAYEYFKDPYHKALALYNAGKYRDILKLLKNKSSYKERLLKAKAAISLGKGKLAREFLTEESPSEIYLIGMSHFIEGNYTTAVEYFEKLSEYDDFRSKAFLRIADSFYNLGNYTKAKELYKRIMLLYPDSQEAYDATLALAQIELQRPTDDLKEIIKDFMAKFPSSPLVKDLKYQLANLYIKEGSIAKARKVLEELKNTKIYKVKALIKLAEITKNPSEKEKLLKKAIALGSPQEKEKATDMLVDLYLKGKDFEKLADLLSEGSIEDKKRAVSIYLSENPQKAKDLFENIIKEHIDEEIRALALELFKKTEEKKYLLIARDSISPRVRAEALYILGKLSENKNKRKALEYYIELILSAEGIQPYYNKSILRASDILVSLKARKDASCLLERLERKFLSEEELKKVKILKEKLPKCEVKK